jgi:group I intron endonuclease
MADKIKTPVIYKITNLITNKIYIGSTNNFHLRKYTHLNHLRNNKHCNKILQNSWNKHSEINFNFEIIEHTTQDNLMILEQYYLDLYKPYNKDIGYNIAKLACPNNSGIKHITKQIAWNKGLKLPASWNKNKKLTKEHKEKLSISAKLRKRLPCSNETKIKISLKQIGKNGNNYGKPTNRKKVYKFDLNNNLIKEYDFLSEVTKDGFNFKKVSAVALGKGKTHKNYKWSYNINYEC